MQDIIDSLREVLNEGSLPKAAQTKIEEVITILEGPGDERLKANKVLFELEELSYNTTIPSFIRTQLWNVSSMLETV
jgi:uncharacterized protein (UPF0147 family)